MNIEVVLSKLDENTREWFNKLTSDDLVSILSAVYKIPDLIKKHSDNITPVYIGQDGECKFSEICKKLPVGFKLINTTKIGKQGDFVIEYICNGKIYRCLVDIKNYRSTVPTREIQKFYTDIIYGSYNAGIIISYFAKFTRIEDSIYIENKIVGCETIPIMYLSEIPESVVHSCIEILFTKIIVNEEKHTNISKIENAIQTINFSVQQSALVRRHLNELNMDIMQKIQKCSENLINMELGIKNTLKDLNVYSTGNSSKNQVQEVAPQEELPENQLKKIPKSKPKKK